MRIAIVGAGLLGLTSAHFLRLRGAEVTVFEHRGEVGLETSFANGGMLHASQASPWNEPGVAWHALRMLGREDAALLIRPRALPRMLGWTWRFFRASQPRRFFANLDKNARLAGYSLKVLNQHFAAFGPAFERADRGTLKIYRTPRELESGVRAAERCRAWNVAYEVFDATRVAALEPALAPIEKHIAGGIHFPGDVSGDAHLFCRALATDLVARGVELRLNTAVSRVVDTAGRVEGVMARGELHRADAVLLAAASNTAALAARLGVRVPVEPIKGYSITVPLDNWTAVPRIPVIDEHYHAAVCPLGKRLRIAGTAEFAGFDLALTPSRIANLYALVERIYPDGARQIERSEVQEWAGLRPMSPDGVGIMGRTRLHGLYLNTGHGHLGWTMAPGAGKLVADEIVGEPAELDRADYALARFAS